MLGRRVREEKDSAPKCPFCHELLDIPENIKSEGGDFLGGRCSCGAVYACDPTGHNVGQAYLDALMYAYGDDWDRLNSSGETDYSEAVFNYDVRTHRLTPVEDIRRDFSGKIFFVKLRGKE